MSFSHISILLVNNIFLLLRRFRLFPAYFIGLSIFEPLLQQLLFKPSIRLREHLMLIDQTPSPVSDDLHSINEGLFRQFANQEGFLSGWLDKRLFCCTQKLLRLTAELKLLCLLLAFTLFAMCPRENSLTRHNISPKLILRIDLDSFLMNLVISQRKKILFVLF